MQAFLFCNLIDCKRDFTVLSWDVKIYDCCATFVSWQRVAIPPSVFNPSWSALHQWFYHSPQLGSLQNSYTRIALWPGCPPVSSRMYPGRTSHQSCPRNLWSFGPMARFSDSGQNGCTLSASLFVLACVLTTSTIASWGDGMWSRDDLDIKVAGKRLNVWHSECPTWVWRTLWWKNRCELCKPESGENGDDVGLVREVEVKILIQRKGLQIVIKCYVVLRGGRSKEMGIEARKHLFNITDTKCPGGWGLEEMVSGELESNAVLEAFPFSIGEELAPGGIAECHGLIWA